MRKRDTPNERASDVLQFVWNSKIDSIAESEEETFAAYFGDGRGGGKPNRVVVLQNCTTHTHSIKIYGINVYEFITQSTRFLTKKKLYVAKIEI